MFSTAFYCVFVFPLDSVKESSTVASPATPPSVKKPRVVAKKTTTKLKLPGDDAVPESSQETTTDLSQDFFPERTQTSARESNSVLLSSLSKNRFSLGSIPVPKLKKSSKNPFASGAVKEISDVKPKPRGRPAKLK